MQHPAGASRRAEGKLLQADHSQHRAEDQEDHQEDHRGDHWEDHQDREDQGGIVVPKRRTGQRDVAYKALEGKAKVRSKAVGTGDQARKANKLGVRGRVCLEEQEERDQNGTAVGKQTDNKDAT